MINNNGLSKDVIIVSGKIMVDESMMKGYAKNLIDKNLQKYYI